MDFAICHFDYQTFGYRGTTLQESLVFLVQLIDYLSDHTLERLVAL